MTIIGGTLFPMKYGVFEQEVPPYLHLVTVIISPSIKAMFKDVEDFDGYWQQLVNTSISIKFDYLVIVVPKVIQNMQGYTGSLSEQSVEWLHIITNQEARAVQNLANKTEKAEFLMKVGHI
jgi:hypothetical protein